MNSLAITKDIRHDLNTCNFLKIDNIIEKLESLKDRLIHEELVLYEVDKISAEICGVKKTQIRSRLKTDDVVMARNFSIIYGVNVLGIISKSISDSYNLNRCSISSIKKSHYNRVDPDNFQFEYIKRYKKFLEKIQLNKTTRYEQ